MADKAGLKWLGFAYGGVTAVVALVAGFVTLTQVERRSIEAAAAAPPAVPLPVQVPSASYGVERRP